jgi:hypothetical protein
MPIKKAGFAACLAIVKTLWRLNFNRSDSLIQFQARRHPTGLPRPLQSRCGVYSGTSCLIASLS